MDITENKRNLYKMLLSEIAKLPNLHGAIAKEFLGDFDRLFYAYERERQVPAYTYQQKIFDLLSQWDSLSPYDQNFVIGVSKYYAESSQTRRQEKYLDRVWREMQKNQQIELEDPELDGVDISDSPFNPYHGSQL